MFLHKIYCFQPLGSIYLRQSKIMKTLNDYMEIIEDKEEDGFVGFEQLTRPRNRENFKFCIN